MSQELRFRELPKGGRAAVWYPALAGEKNLGRGGLRGGCCAILILRGAGSTTRGRNSFTACRKGGRDGILLDECREGRKPTLPGAPFSLLAPNTTAENSLVTGLIGLTSGCSAIGRAEAIGEVTGNSGVVKGAENIASMAMGFLEVGHRSAVLLIFLHNLHLSPLHFHL